MTKRGALAPLAASALAACAHGPVAPAVSAAETEILRLDAGRAGAASRGDAGGALAALGDDAVHCGPRGVALGREGIAAAWAARFPPDGPLVAWTPERAAVAASGDLGFTAGRSRVVRGDREGRAPVATGEHLTVWARDPDGWRAALELASSRPAAELGPGLERREVRALRSAAGDLEASLGLWERAAGDGPRAGAYITVRRRAGAALEVVEDRATPFAPAEAAASAVVLLDAAWAWSMARGDADGFRSLVAGDAVFAGRRLLEGLDEIWAAWKAFFAEGGPTLRWAPARGEAAGSGDLAWTTGRWRLGRRGSDGKPAASEGRYLTVWARDERGAWRVALDGGLEPAEALGEIERVAVRRHVSRDGTLEAALGTWRQEGRPGGRSGAWIRVRRRSGGEWKTVLDGATPFPAPG